MFSHEYTLTHLGEKTFDAEGHFELAITESEEKAPAVRMDCVFETHFHSKNPIRPDDAERFVGSELKLILVPHARQFFFALSGQMAIPPVVVPLTTRANASRRKKKVRVPA
jgi:hypothetical protein